nr:MAG TPA: HypF [Caudoviricetes sp.]
MNVCVMCKREYEPFISRHHWAPSMCPECAEKYNQEKRILDSGERTTFSTGAQRDMHSGKGRMDLLPWAAIIEVSKHCEAGALKYGTHNVDKGIPTSSLMDSAMRHAAKYLDGQEDEDHLLAAAWNLLWAVQMRCKNPECVDTPWSKERQGGADT